MDAIAIVETVEVETPQEALPLPGWYTNAPIEDSERGRLMDEVRTALLDCPDGLVEQLTYGCVRVWLFSRDYTEGIANHLIAKGFSLTIDIWAIPQSLVVHPKPGE